MVLSPKHGFYERQDPIIRWLLDEIVLKLLPSTNLLNSHWLQISRIAGQVRKIENPETLPQERF